MDTLTHALSGALLARATAPVGHYAGQLTIRARMTVGFVAAAFPDCDFVLRLFDTLTYVSLHRGVTHSIILLPVWALLVAWLLSVLTHRRYSWQAIFGTAALGIAIHIAGDVFTAYGTMLLMPFSSHRFAIPFTFIIDPYFTGIIATGLAAVMIKPQKRHAAVIACLVLGCYVGFQGILHSRAVTIGETYAENHGLMEAEVHAFPQPLSPFNWKIIVSHEGNYDIALVNLWRTQSRQIPDPASGLLGMWGRIAAGYRPVSAATWVRRKRFGETKSQNVLAREAWEQDIFARFREFAAFPVLDQIESRGSRVCVSFFDLRFSVPSLPPSLVFGLCRDSAVGPWRLDDSGIFGRD
ncbi:metal-dependent hydrolase [Nitrosovibrio sp. Nv4]|uniref:metal-dependent hydrolase n=1 Tax=Nitrosovibrio sp. Nv4 TaxID=1945880 RepID=UPI000BC8DD54|nr:metal-dependent hydrolase [Nitrosovibrio sp. Nv4]SOD42084.1 inner membrane protein [Nitrosovibrio sp. Nv4]